MAKIFLGIILGVMIAGLVWVLVPVIRDRQTPSTIGRFTPSPTATNAAGIGSNVASHLPSSQRVAVTIDLSDSGAADTTVAGTTDLTSLELAVTKVEAQLSPDSSFYRQSSDPQAWETLNVSQPTIELFSLRGSGAVAELGTTELAPTTYQALRLTVESIKGRRSSGQIMDVDLAGQTKMIELRRPLNWSSAGQPIQFVIDLDSLAGLSQTDTHYTFTPTIRRVIQNDQTLK